MVLATIGIFLILLAAYVRWRNQERLTGPLAEVNQIFLLEQELLATYDQAKTALAEEKIDAETFVNIIKTEVLAPWREAQSRLRKVDFNRLTEKGKRLFESLQRMMKLREQAWGLVVDSIREGSGEGMESAAQKAAEADRLEDEIFAEMKAESGAANEGPMSNGTPRRASRRP